MIELSEIKNYLRVDYDDDDELLESLLASSKKFCLDILRSDDESLLETLDTGKVAVFYCTAYLYEHREGADYRDLALTLRALLYSKREGAF